MTLSLQLNANVSFEIELNGCHRNVVLYTRTRTCYAGWLVEPGKRLTAAANSAKPMINEHLDSLKLSLPTVALLVYILRLIIIKLYCHIQRALHDELECSLALTHIMPICTIK